jgi:hypothetical protein
LFLFAKNGARKRRHVQDRFGPEDGHQFREKLRYLLGGSGIDHAMFPGRFAEFAHTNSSTAHANALRAAQSWLPTGDVEPKVPNDNYRKLLARYFSAERGREIDPNIFHRSHTYDSFVKWFEAKSISTDGLIALPVPGDAHTLKPQTVQYLCGVYVTYRLSFADQAIVREFLIIDRDPSSQTILRASIHTLPVANASYFSEKDKLKVEVSDSSEIFGGILYRFGPMFHAVTMCCNDLGETKDRRFRNLYFPILSREQLLGAARYCHYGILTAYSGRRAGPIASRVIAMKIADDPLWGANVYGLVSLMGYQVSEVVEFVPLLSNHISSAQTVLTIHELDQTVLIAGLKEALAALGRLVKLPTVGAR